MSEKICTTCGFKGSPKRFTKGSFIIELGLWLCFLVPGLIYSIWRLASRYEGCPKCHGSAMIPLDSPLAQSPDSCYFPPFNPPWADSRSFTSRAVRNGVTRAVNLARASPALRMAAFSSCSLPADLACT